MGKGGAGKQHIQVNEGYDDGFDTALCLFTNTNTPATLFAT